MIVTTVLPGVLTNGMSGVLDGALAPLELAVSHVLVGADAALTAAGVPASPAWPASIGVLVVVVRLALLPLAVRQARSARRLAAAAPALREVRQRYRGRRDPASLAALRAETARVRAEAGASPLGCLPLLVQAPVLLALFRVLDAAARGSAVGALGPALVAQLDSATIAGASLTSGLLTGGAASGVAVVLTLVLAGALWLAQHRQLTRNTAAAALEGPLGATQRLMVWIAPAAASLSALTFPVGVLLYFACANSVSLVQQLAVIRWLPTPGSPAAGRA